MEGVNDPHGESGLALATLKETWWGITVLMKHLVMDEDAYYHLTEAARLVELEIVEHYGRQPLREMKLASIELDTPEHLRRSTAPH